MSLHRALLALLLSGPILLSLPARAQISAGGQPLGLGKAATRTRAVSTVRIDDGVPAPHAYATGPTTLAPDRATLLPHAYGTKTDVAIDVKAAGAERRLPGGGRLWQLRISAPGARGLRLTYDRFRVPPGASFFVYDARGTTVRGAFTARNNASHGGFATALTPGEHAILEYYEPADAAFSGEIRVTSVVRAHRRPYATAPLSGEAYQASALTCSINTACPEGDSWSEEARATVLIDRGGNTCSGVLLNNTSQDFTPYILTAHHCGTPAVGDTLDWLVTFNYASPTCSDPSTTPPARSMAGVVVRAAQSGWREDYALLELLNPIPPRYDAYYAGWSIEESPSPIGVTTGHPRGDIRKITFDTDRLTDLGTRWTATFDHGTVEGGSSGAPLFNEAHHVVGHVRGAWSIDLEACSGPGGDDNAATIVFPKLAHIWNVGSPGARVADFLDPLESSPSHLDGIDSAPAVSPVPAWISEVDTRTATSSDDDVAEFIELSGPAGLALAGYRIDVYTCSDGRTARHASEVISPGPGATLSDEYRGVGFFVIGGKGLPAATTDRRFSSSAADRLPDGRGLVLLRDPSGREVFDYQYDETVEGASLECPASRVTRSRGDDVRYGPQSAAPTRRSTDRENRALGSTAIGFRDVRPSSLSASGTAGMVPSPGRKNAQTMPVALTRFDANVDGSTVHLSWTTASETNNAGYEVQEREDGSPGAWETVAVVEGAGTTVVDQHYRYQIRSLSPGRYVFRLRQFDYGGASSLSPEVAVEVQATSPYRLSRPHPNPFRQEATLTLTVTQSQQVEVVLYDVLGRRIAALHDGAVRANQPMALHIDAGSLSSGLYIVRVVGERFSASQKLTLLR